MSTDLAFDPIVIVFNGDPVTAVGGNMWVTDINFNVIPGEITVMLSDGTKDTFPSSAKSTFRGYTSEVPISKVEITPFANGGVNGWATLDNLYVGTAAGGPPPGCYPDCDGSEALNLFDFLCFVQAFNAGEDYADCNESGDLNLFDFLCFVQAFNAGC